jgi:flagella basal body P-ring formation protein FlgA
MARMMHTLTLITALFTSSLIAPVVMAQGSAAKIPSKPTGVTAVSLKQQVTIPLGSGVVLADVATITGPNRDSLAAISVLAPRDIETLQQGTLTRLAIDCIRIKRLLDQAGVSWSSTTLSGGSVELLITAPPSKAPASAAQLASEPDPRPSANLESSTLALSPTRVDASLPEFTATSTQTLADLIGSEISLLANLPRERLRIRFDQLQPADQEWIQQAVRSEWVYSVRMLGSAITGRSPMRIEAFAGDRLAFQKTLQLEVHAEGDVVTAASAINKGDTLTLDNLVVKTQWLPIGQAQQLLPLDQLIGMSAKRRLNPGQALVIRDVESPIAIRRGDDVVVHVLSGGLVIKSKARALSAGREGDMVSLQVDGSKKTFSARIAGRGRAVVRMNEEMEP